MMFVDICRPTNIYLGILPLNLPFDLEGHIESQT